MVNLLIIDDEEEISMGIKSIIEWESNGIHICGVAENGKEAIEKIEKLHPEIILLDIRMPVMSGLQVLQHIKLHNYSTKSIILSGYDDFAYAQTALKNGASDFLLKPCLPQEILETVLKVKSQIKEEKEKKELLEGLKIRFNESLPLLKEMYLTKLIRSGGKLKSNFLENSKLYKIDLTDTDISIALIRIDDFSALVDQNSNDDVELFKFAIKNITTEILGSKLKCEIIQSYDEIIALFNDKDNYHIFGLLEEVKENIKKYMKFSVSIGVGRPCTNIDNIFISYSEAVKSIDAAFFVGNNSIVKYEDIKGFNSDEKTYPINEEVEILSSIKSGKSGDLEEKIEGFFRVLSKTNFSKDMLLKSGLALLMSLYHLCIEKSIETDNIFGNFQSSINSFLRLDSLVSVKARLVELAVASCEKLNNKKNSNKIIEQTLKFIDNNYGKDLNLETVANKVFITPSYLSLLFKQTMGINFVDYQHKVRIEKACEFLKDISLKTYEVAYKVGYSDEKYFSQLFKKYTSMTPTQYKSTL